jgi:hypothetical protein
MEKLNFKIHDVWGKINDFKTFEKINNFSNLISLELNGFKFQKNYKIKLQNITSLNLRNCSCIELSDSDKLDNLMISNTDIKENKSLSKFKNLEKCELINYRNNQNFYSIIDFSNLINLKNLTCLPHDFIYLTEKSLVEKIDLMDMGGDTSKDIEKNIFNKIFNLKHLKEINFCINYIDDFDEILENIEKNISLIKMHIMFKHVTEINSFSEFIKKFENLSELDIHINIGEEESIMELNINQDKNCKIEKLSIFGFGFEKFEVTCGPYSDMTELIFHENGQISNLEEAFPLFQKNSDIKFNRLNKFIYSNWEIDLFETPVQVLENLYNNLNKMTNLKIFELSCVCNEISKEFHEKFIRKLLEMKLDDIKFNVIKKDEDEQMIFTNDYTNEELIELYPDTLTNKKYNISKYQEIEE